MRYSDKVWVISSTGTPIERALRDVGEGQDFYLSKADALDAVANEAWSRSRQEQQPSDMHAERAKRAEDEAAKLREAS